MNPVVYLHVADVEGSIVCGPVVPELSLAAQHHHGRHVVLHDHAPEIKGRVLNKYLRQISDADLEMLYVQEVVTTSWTHSLC